MSGHFITVNSLQILIFFCCSEFTTRLMQPQIIKNFVYTHGTDFYLFLELINVNKKTMPHFIKFSKSIYEISRHFERFKFELKYVPIQIKNILLRIAGHRLHLLEDIDLLSSLVHPYVEDITLTDCTVNDRMLKAIEECPRLKKFQMGNTFKNVTFEGFARLFPKIPNLEYLIVRKCDVFDDRLVDIMSRSCPKLRALDLSNCFNITDSSMANISMLNLSALTISGTNISDKGIVNLLEGVCAETLTELNACRCSISDTSFLLVIDKCKKISIFTLNDTKYTGNVPPPDSNNLKQLAWTIF